MTKILWNLGLIHRYAYISLLQAHTPAVFYQFSCRIVQHILTGYLHRVPLQCRQCVLIRHVCWTSLVSALYTFVSVRYTSLLLHIVEQGLPSRFIWWSLIASYLPSTHPVVTWHALCSCSLSVAIMLFCHSVLMWTAPTEAQGGPHVTVLPSKDTAKCSCVWWRRSQT